jgi:hypothetical protein
LFTKAKLGRWHGEFTLFSEVLRTVANLLEILGADGRKALGELPPDAGSVLFFGCVVFFSGDFIRMDEGVSLAVSVGLYCSVRYGLTTLIVAI